MMKIAETVKVRPEPEYLFDVDGEPFPWFLTRSGPTVARYPMIYVVHVQLYCLDLKTKAVLDFRSSGYNGHTPVIGGVEFPWDITDDGYVYQSGTKVLPSVTLSFLAREVDIDPLLIDDRREVRNINGEHVA